MTIILSRQVVSAYRYLLLFALNDIMKKGTRKRRDNIIWVCILLIPMVFYPWAIKSTLHANSDIHSLMEFWAGVTAIVCSVVILINYFATSQRFFLVVSIGFALQGAEDLVHAIYSFRDVGKDAISGIENFIPGTYVTGRLLLIVFILIAFIYLLRNTQDSKTVLTSIISISAGILFAAAATWVIIHSPLPKFILKGSLISRPVDFSVSLLYAIAAIMFMRYFRKLKERDPFILSLVISLILGFVTQVYMIHSQGLYDTQFNISHIIKILSYYAPILGIGYSILSMFSTEARLKQNLDVANKNLEHSNKKILALNKQQKAQNVHLKVLNNELQSFTYVASHDLQEPLRTVSSFLDLIKIKYSEKLDKAGLEFIDFAIDGSTRMKQLISDLLEFSRIETKGEAFVQIDLNKVYNDVIEDLHAAIKESKITISTDKLPTVSADGFQMKQLFQNLITNAIKFRRDSEPRLDVTVKKEDNKYIISFADNGIGIQKDYYNKIFVIFQRLHTREEYEGTGIGLAVCKKILQRHNGEIWLESEFGQGTTFSCSIPENQ